MKQPDFLKQRIGIIGGGQLGKMMILEAKKMGFYIMILDPTVDCPAHSIADAHIVAEFDDKQAIRELAEKVDVVTYEFEHIGVDALKELEEEGYKVYPTAKSLEIIQNKFTQKKVLQEKEIPVPTFLPVQQIGDILDGAKQLGYPLVLKSCLGGYDGKGNAVIKNEKEISAAYKALGAGKTPLMLEQFIPFTKEISVLACRGLKGDIAVYPVGENIHEDNILRETRVPANISPQLSDQAMGLAHQVMEVFEGIGMFCVELFVTEEEQLLINEVAPRPHNSGHYSIEGCITSQFEQHIRAIIGLPLGDTTLIQPTVMRNILGEENALGRARITGVEAVMKIPGTYLHIYGKGKVSPKRKMGHLTAIGSDLNEASQRANEASEYIKVIEEK